MFDWKSMNISKILYHYNLVNSMSSGVCLCPRHENDGLPHKPSCKIYRNFDKDVIVCHGGCTNENGNRLCLDNISLIAELEGLDCCSDFKEICILLEKLDNLYTDDFDGEKVNKNIINYRTTETIEPKEIKKTTLYDILFNSTGSKTFDELHQEKKYFLDDYFNKRSILIDKCRDVLEENNIIIKHNYYKSENSVIFFDTNWKFGVKRKIDDYLKGKVYKEDEHLYDVIDYVRYFKIKGGSNVVVFESMHDALALYSHMKHPEHFTFVALNSAANAKMFIDKERELLQNADNILLLVDNDQGGETAIKMFNAKCPKPFKDIRKFLKGANDICDFFNKNKYIRVEMEDLLNYE